MTAMLTKSQFTTYNQLLNVSVLYVCSSDVPDSQFLLSGRSRIVEARGRAGAGYSAGYPAG